MNQALRRHLRRTPADPAKIQVYSLTSSFHYGGTTSVDVRHQGKSHGKPNSFVQQLPSKYEVIMVASRCGSKGSCEWTKSDRATGSNIAESRMERGSSISDALAGCMPAEARGRSVANCV